MLTVTRRRERRPGRGVRAAARPAAGVRTARSRNSQISPGRRSSHGSPSAQRRKGSRSGAAPVHGPGAHLELLAQVDLGRQLRDRLLPPDDLLGRRGVEQPVHEGGLAGRGMDRAEQLGHRGAAEEVDVARDRPFRVVRLRKGGERQARPVAGDPQQPLLVDRPQLPLPPLPLDDPVMVGKDPEEGDQPEGRAGPPPPSRIAPLHQDHREADDESQEQGAAQEREPGGDPGQASLLGGEGVAAVGVEGGGGFRGGRHTATISDRIRPDHGKATGGIRVATFKIKNFPDSLYERLQEKARAEEPLTVSGGDPPPGRGSGAGKDSVYHGLRGSGQGALGRDRCGGVHPGGTGLLGFLTEIGEADRSSLRRNRRESTSASLRNPR